MDDQVFKLKNKGCRAVCISGDMEHTASTPEDVCCESIMFVFGSPEAFINNKQWRCMCLHVRGMDSHFRKWYGELAQL